MMVTADSSSWRKHHSLSDADLQDFAELSGDFNPVHLDPVRARRTVFGKQVAHGILLVLKFLDDFCNEQSQNLILQQFKIAFLRPVGADEEFDIACSSENGVATWTVCDSRRVYIRGKMSVCPGKTNSNCAFLPLSPWERTPEECRDISQLQDHQGELSLGFDARLMEVMFPYASRMLPGIHLGTLLATTRLVGMQIPGLHSLYSELDFSFSPSRQSEWKMQFCVSQVDPRFSRVEIDLAAGENTGKLVALLRPPPTSQPSFSELAGLVRTAEFDSWNVVVVGGSRGLGETVVKLLALGGANVHFTYRNGKEEAAHLIAMGNQFLRKARLSASAYDVLKPPPIIAPWIPTHGFYFATPFISSTENRTFDSNLFRLFNSYYVDGFVAFVMALLQQSEEAIHVFYPSSIFVEEMPVGMAEYAASKSAGETVAGWIARCYPNITVTCPRLPKLATDQTAGMLSTSALPAAPVLLELIRSWKRVG